TSNTASHQHQQEQELLSSFAIPNPPVSTQQSSVAAEKESTGGMGPVDPPRTLWMGDLDPWLDEKGIADLWWRILHKKVSVKIIQPKNSRPDATYHGLAHSGYCFVEFDTFDDAQQALGLNGQLLPDIAMPSQQQYPNNPDNQKKYFRLNWASGATLSAPIVQTPEYSLFVGDLSASTTEAHLLAFFQKNFPTSVKTVRVMTDPVLGKSRCFGFVRFTDEPERQRALIEMNGVWFGGRPLRVALATPRNNTRSRFASLAPPSENYYSHGMDASSSQDLMYMRGPLPPNPPQINSPYTHYGAPPHRNDIYVDKNHENSIKSPLPGGNGQGQPFTDPNNTTVFVGGLSSEVSEATLFTLFQSFGVIQQVKIPPGKNCGFIKYSTREEAEEAIAAMQGFIIGGNRVRLSWGRVSINNKRFQHQQQQVAQAAQIQAAAALSMGMDTASAIAAAAAVAAAGGYPPPPIPGAPQLGGLGPHMGIHGGPQYGSGSRGNGVPKNETGQYLEQENGPGNERSGSFDGSASEEPAKNGPGFYTGPPHGNDYNVHQIGGQQEELMNAMNNLSIGGERGEINPEYMNSGFMVPPQLYNGGYPIPEMQYQQFIPHP
ncbi:RNA-binding domain-containing protein, partial [Suhomyces tanzawaensis NRRL Y-17324]